MRSEMNVVGDRVKQLRNERGWTQEGLATRCQLAGFDISKATIGQIEIRYRTVTDLELGILARIFQVSADDLLPNPLPEWRARG